MSAGPLHLGEGPVRLLQGLHSQWASIPHLPPVKAGKVQRPRRRRPHGQAGGQNERDQAARLRPVSRAQVGRAVHNTEEKLQAVEEEGLPRGLMWHHFMVSRD